MGESVFITSTYKTCTILAILLVLIRFKISKEILQKNHYDDRTLIIIALVFSFLGCLANYFPINVYGTTVSTIRVIIISGGILFGSFVGVLSSLIVSTNFMILDIGCETVIPEVMGIISAGLLAGMANKIIKKHYINRKYKWLIGIIVGFIAQTVALVELILYAKVISQEISIISQGITEINASMTVAQIPIGIFVAVIQDIKDDRQELINKSKIEELKGELNKSKLLFLQSQINPHFLFNTLNTIALLTRTDPQKSRDVISRLSTYIRYNIEAKEEFIHIDDEIEQIKCYVDIQKTRFESYFDMVYDIDDEVDVDIPTLLIQPLIENALEHGILKSGVKGTINLTIRQTENERVYVSVKNTGIPISLDIVKKIYNDQMNQEKIGLYNVYKRLKLIYGEGLIINRLENGTDIEFYIGGKNEGNNS